ncbi:MAG: N-acetylmuramic acid 6-phosphate etherase [Phycisphaerae bacterium]|nr:N-acetylmuramic acid 6-phosphate etherase [Phycisphaerae bacterium]
MNAPPPPPLPPDRSRVPTEASHAASRGLHALPIAACVDLLVSDQLVAVRAVRAAAPALTGFIQAVADRFEPGGRLIYLGAGTSGRLGVLDASELMPTFQLPEGRVVGLIAGGDASLRRSSEHREDDPGGCVPDLQSLRIGRNDAVLGISAGGTTPYVLGALRHANALGPDAPLTGLLACAPMDPPPFVDHLMLLDTGPEVLTGSTRLKAGTATKIALNVISTSLMVRTGRVFDNLMVDLRATNDKLRDRAARIIARLCGIDRPAAFELLDRAGGAVKTAVVMHHRGAGRPEAEALLAAQRGRLDQIL